MSDPSLKIIHLRARLHRFYRFKKGQFLVVALILLACLVFGVTFLTKSITHPDTAAPVAYDDGDDEDLSSITFYEKMMQDYKDEISSAEELQLKVMNDIIKDSMMYIKKNHKGRNYENRVNLANERNKRKLQKMKKAAAADSNVNEDSGAIRPKALRDMDSQQQRHVKQAQLHHEYEEDHDIKHRDYEEGTAKRMDPLNINNIDIRKDNDPSIIPESRLDLIKKMFTELLPIITESAPKLGYQLQNEKDIGSRRGKFRLSTKIFPRTYGRNGVVNIAIHDTSEKFPILSKDFLNDCLYLPTDMFEVLKRSHEYFVSHIPDHYAPNTYSGEGIVFIGGGKFSWLSLLSIENLRSAGSKLPIEVMIPQPEEYEPQMCEIILPRLNAKCLLLYEIFPDIMSSEKTKKKDSTGFKLTGYQYKSLSLLASTFEKVLFLDSDNISVLNPDVLFHSEPFTSHGMILWPDFWRRVTHPMFYDLAGFNITERRVRNLMDKVTPPEVYTTGAEDPDTEVPLHDREGAIPDLSTESGQIIVDKKTHFKALLLSFYYNVYGPRHFYPLFSQGGNGEGDKETFIAASVFYNLPVYQMNKPVGVVGHWSNDDYEGVGMIQYDPIIDKLNEDHYKNEILRRINEEGDNFHYGKMDFFNYLNDAEARPMFFHSNYPKLDPISLFGENKLVDPDGNQWRMYSDQPDIGFDFELKQWQLINKYFCSVDEPFQMRYLEDSNVSMEKLCRAIESRLEFLRSTGLRFNYD